MAYIFHLQIDGLVQDCSISSVIAMEILQSCTEPLKYLFIENFVVWYKFH